jgi:hypothetical protein
MCTVWAVINKQGQEMKEVNKYDAPEGYVAVAVNMDKATCKGCCFFETVKGWGGTKGRTCTLPLDDVLRPRMCSSERRADEQDVIFKRKDEMSESLKTALGNLPLALERFRHYKKEAADLHHD